MMNKLKDPIKTENVHYPVSFETFCL